MNTQPYFKAAARQIPQTRYVLLDFEERMAYGFHRQNPYTKLFEDRIVFLGVQVDDASMDDIMTQLPVLESQDPDSLITMYINPPGGSFTAPTAAYDMMQYIKPQIQTVCLGQAASAVAVLLATGPPGKRLALPGVCVLIRQPVMEGIQRQVSGIQIIADEIGRMRTWLENTISKHSSKPVEQVRCDIGRDRILTTPQVVEYGLIDQVLESRKAL